MEAKTKDTKTENIHKETSFRDPTLEQIKELQDEPKNMVVKKRD